MKSLFKIILTTAFTFGMAGVALAAPPPPASVGGSVGTIIPAVAAVAFAGVWWMVRKNK
jgi:hypothetical protein